MNRQRAGFTFIEALVAIGLLSLFAGLAGSIVTRTWRTATIESQTGQLQLTTNIFLERLNDQLNQAVAVANSSGSYSTSNTTIIIKVPAYDSSKTIIPSTYDHIVFQQDPTNPQQLKEITIVSNGSSRRAGSHIITNNISSLSFSYYDINGNSLTSDRSSTKQVRATVVVSKTEYGKNWQYSNTKYSTLRNR